MLYSAKTLACSLAVALAATLAAPGLGVAPAAAQISISVNIAPPVLPVYVQPPLPAPGYVWTPGYWAWDPIVADYYWVPGAWVAPPRIGFLWTPGYWGWSNGVYLFHAGYWGPTVGFYGGVNYGFGYTGSGFFGGQWRGGQYYYNSSVNNVKNVAITNVYNKTVIVNNNAPRTSFNGGPNGIAARPTPAEIAAAKAPHIAATPVQTQHALAAKANPQARFSANQGKPQNAAVEKPLGAAPPQHGEAAVKGAGENGAEPRHDVERRDEAASPRAPAALIDRPHPRPAMERRPAPMRVAMPRPMPHPAPRGGGGCRGPHCR
jgi:hypothetical protein